MTDVSRDDVTKLASLSSLQLSDDEIDSLRKDIARILEYVEQLNELDTEGVEATYQVTGLTNVTRKDTVESDEAMKELLLSLAPERIDNEIKVPKVL